MPTLACLESSILILSKGSQGRIFRGGGGGGGGKGGNTYLVPFPGHRHSSPATKGLSHTGSCHSYREVCLNSSGQQHPFLLQPEQEAQVDLGDNKSSDNNSSMIDRLLQQQKAQNKISLGLIAHMPISSSFFPKIPS